jgi:hypothetical protein
MTSLEWFYFRLKNLPAAMLQDKATYPSLDSSVVQVQWGIMRLVWSSSSIPRPTCSTGFGSPSWMRTSK